MGLYLRESVTLLRRDDGVYFQPNPVTRTFQEGGISGLAVSHRRDVYTLPGEAPEVLETIVATRYINLED